MILSEIFAWFWIIVPIQSYYYSAYKLPVSFQLRNFSETDSFWIFLLEASIGVFGCYFFMFLLIFSLSFFVLFVYYIIGQTQLIAYYIGQVHLNNPQIMAHELKEIVELHLDVLEKIKKLSDLFTIKLKADEYLIYSAMIIGVFGKENLNMILLATPLVPLTVIGFCSFLAEQIIDAEETIRDAYYDLDWPNANVISCKLLLLAMQKPVEIRFGGIFGYDFISLQRFTDVVHNSYNFALILLNLAKN